jgi:GTPase Era involved in 16S rRNA processing
MKEIASAARLDMERLFGGQVFLEVWVRVTRGGPTMRPSSSVLGISLTGR